MGRGEEVVIARAGVPVARMVAVGKQPKVRRPGSAKGQFTVPENFDDPLPNDIMAAFR